MAAIPGMTESQREMFVEQAFLVILAVVGHEKDQPSLKDIIPR